MKPLIYIYEEDLATCIAQQSSRFYVREHRGEDVFHLSLSAPSASRAASEIGVKLFFSHLPETHNRALVEFEESDDANLSLGIFVLLEAEGLFHSRRYAARLKRGLDVVDCELKFVPLKEDLYSRSKGLLETDALAQKRALIIGLGSFGSTIAIELAKSGVGQFTLMDFDRLDVTNVARHVCGLNDLGRYKTYAMRDLILAKNPFAEVETIEQDVVGLERRTLADLMNKADIVICATDNNKSRFIINDLALETGTTVIYGRAYTRAEGGDVFIVNGKIAESNACYACLVGNHAVEEEISSKRQVEDLPAYVAPEEREARIQVGLSSDILPICNMMVKLALLELTALDNGEAMERLRAELPYNYYFWANRREKRFLNFAPFNEGSPMPTIFKWHGVMIERDDECLSCNLDGVAQRYSSV